MKKKKVISEMHLLDLEDGIATITDIPITTVNKLLYQRHKLEEETEEIEDNLPTLGRYQSEGNITSLLS
jgi:hypothetical protein